MTENDIFRFAMDELMNQFTMGLRDVVKLEKYNDPVQCATVLRGVVGVVDLRNC